MPEEKMHPPSNTKWITDRPLTAFKLQILDVEDQRIDLENNLNYMLVSLCESRYIEARQRTMESARILRQRAIMLENAAAHIEFMCERTLTN